MPQIFYAPQPESEPCLVFKNGVDQHACILERRDNEVYVHYANTDKRLDEWVPEEMVRAPESVAHAANDQREASEAASSVSTSGAAVANVHRKRKRSMSLDVDGADGGASETGASAGGAIVKMSEEEYDIEHHKQITAKRNFDKVIFGKWQIKTWYFSPYPLTEAEIDDHGHTHTHPVPMPLGSGPSSNAGSISAPSVRAPSSTRIPGVARASFRSHGRTSDLLAGGLGRGHVHGAALWVCDKCFKYMAEGASWELHVRKCTMRHPPGRKVYQRGAHIIWEVDGAKEKLYCQNLSLFGKLFIDVKTLFFDCDNFLFYILTDADSQRDHVLGFFSKEKISYDDYNLACIVVLPPYQKKGYGMLLIEFSYELSRRAAKLGTPERPLSDLGLRSYLTYWIATLVRYFRHLLSVLPTNTNRLVVHGSFPSHGQSHNQSQNHNHSHNQGLSAPQTDIEGSVSPVRENEDVTTNGHRAKRRKSTKGWDGEFAAGGDNTADADEWGPQEDDVLYTTHRMLETTANADGSATTHAAVQCTLADIARATGLRIDDVAFALNECGLLVRRRRRQVPDSLVPETKNQDAGTEANEVKKEREKGEEQGSADRGRDQDEDEDEECIVISREMVETVARARGVKKMCMNRAHVLL